MECNLEPSQCPHLCYTLNMGKARSGKIMLVLQPFCTNPEYNQGNFCKLMWDDNGQLRATGEPEDTDVGKES